MLKVEPMGLSEGSDLGWKREVKDNSRVLWPDQLEGRH